jgi:DNA-directed RNA polymerase I subunit RPA43
MLCITGSLLSDPSNPPPAPEAPAPTTQIQDSPTPEPEEETPRRPVKKARVVKESLNSSQATPHHSQEAPSAVYEEPEEEVDESMLTERELKKKRKDEVKAKNNLRKERKAGERMMAEQEAQADTAVPIPIPGAASGEGQEAGKKRKGGDEEGGKKKKKKKD